jgi:hypothetical protein
MILRVFGSYWPAWLPRDLIASLVPELRFAGLMLAAIMFLEMLSEPDR